MPLFYIFTNAISCINLNRFVWTDGFHNLRVYIRNVIWEVVYKKPYLLSMNNCVRGLIKSSCNFFCLKNYVLIHYTYIVPVKVVSVGYNTSLPTFYQSSKISRMLQPLSPPSDFCFTPSADANYETLPFEERSHWGIPKIIDQWRIVRIHFPYLSFLSLIHI